MEPERTQGLPGQIVSLGASVSVDPIEALVRRMVKDPMESKDLQRRGKESCSLVFLLDYQFCRRVLAFHCYLDQPSDQCFKLRRLFQLVLDFPIDLKVIAIYRVLDQL